MGKYETVEKSSIADQSIYPTGTRVKITNTKTGESAEAFDKSKSKAEEKAFDRLKEKEKKK